MRVYPTRLRYELYIDCITFHKSTTLSFISAEQVVVIVHILLKYMFLTPKNVKAIRKIRIRSNGKLK